MKKTEQKRREKVLETVLQSLRPDPANPEVIEFPDLAGKVLAQDPARAVPVGFLMWVVARYLRHRDKRLRP
jgi:hypothetical protein